MSELINKSELEKFVHKNFEETIVPTLMKYIEVPNVSPSFDKDWETNGFQEQAVDLLVSWAKAQDIENFEIEVIKETGKTPLVYITVEGTTKDAPTILLYGHLDKQPPFEGWDEDKHPYKPVIIDNKLYGRGF
jgi:acetylornithine deacetylase/succinyl-diaminopimelate desuccinylase-like protein